MKLPSQYRCQARDDFIGPALVEAERIERIIKACRESGRAPIKLLLLGQPGCGKSELAEHFCRIVGASKWATHKYNGTELKIEHVESLANTVHYTNMFGDYRIVRIEEVDKIPTVAQVRLLTLLDDLPPSNAVIATSNCTVKDLETRFQTRFQLIAVKPPTDGEVSSLLMKHWRISKAVALQIATIAQGNVRSALLDAQTFLA